MTKFEVGKIYKNKYSKTLYKCEYVGLSLAAVLSWDHTDLSGKVKRIDGSIASYQIDEYEEYKEPVIEYRYARAVLVDYADGQWDQSANTTFWTRKKAPSSDNLKGTWTDGILTSVEIIK